MNYKKAQELSPCHTAVLGNVVMKDVIWPKDSEFPYMWITNGYTLMKSTR